MKKNMIKILKWIPATVILSISWILSNQEHVVGMPSFWNADKLVHFVCFGGFCFWVAFGCNTKSFPKKFVVLPVMIVSFYGIIDEIHQSFVPGRESSVLDWCADTLGAVLGVFIFLSIRKLLKK